MTEKSPSRVEGGEGSGCKGSGLGCLGLVALAAIALGALNSGASATLDARLQQASLEIADLHESQAERRSTILGAPKNDYNAAVDYAGIEWALTAGDEDARRLAWRTQRPELPDDIDEVVALMAPKPGGKPLDYTDVATLADEFDMDRPPGPLGPRETKQLKRALAAFARARPALRYVRDGLKRGRCDWEVNWERGMRADVPNLLTLRMTGILLAYEATLQPPREAVQTGLEIVAFSQDIGRHGTIIGGMMAAALAQIGFKSLTHTLQRPGLEEADYRRILNVLASYEPPDNTRMLKTEQIVMIVSALEISGRRLDKGDAQSLDSDDLGDSTLGAYADLSVLHLRELRGYEHFMSRQIEISELPRAQQKAAYDALMIELDESYYTVAKLVMPNFGSATAQLNQALAGARVVRALAAAHVLRLQQGSFPASFQPIANLLGEGADDPCAPTLATPLLFSLSNGVVTCWTVGEDGVDNGGPPDPPAASTRPAPQPRQTDDLGFRTRAPASK